MPRGSVAWTARGCGTGCTASMNEAPKGSRTAGRKATGRASRRSSWRSSPRSLKPAPSAPCMESCAGAGWTCSRSWPSASASLTTSARSARSSSSSASRTSAHAVLLLDRAGWHTTGRLVVPKNITLVFLPSRAPELNPVENIWQYLRQNWLSHRRVRNLRSDHRSGLRRLASPPRRAHHHHLNRPPRLGARRSEIKAVGISGDAGRLKRAGGSDALTSASCRRAYELWQRRLPRRRRLAYATGGAGHSAALHSHDEEHIRQMGLELPISRLVVNQASALTAGGSLTNGFAPTTTLGCGSWGGNSISENLDFKHLMNVSRIGKVITHKRVPSDAEIWA